MSSSNKSTIFLVAAVSFLANNITALLIVDSFIIGYTIIESNDDIVTLSLSTFISSSLSFFATMLGIWKHVCSSLLLYPALSYSQDSRSWRILR